MSFARVHHPIRSGYGNRWSFLTKNDTIWSCNKSSSHRCLQKNLFHHNRESLVLRYNVTISTTERFFVTTTKKCQQKQQQPSEIVFKPWKEHMIESNGDYRVEASKLEDHIGGPLYEYQNELPRLPIPSLQESIDRFLPTALPLAKSKEEAKNLIAACNVFVEEAEVLQERLVARKDVDMKNSSWLQLWWNQLGYLQVRDPVVVFVSYFFQFIDDPTLDNEPASNPANIQRGAAILFATAEFRKLVCSGQLPAEMIRKKPLCSTAYKYMFHACRIPQVKEDTYRIYDPSRYTHCIVARKGHFFSIELLDQKTGDPLPISVLEDQLEECIALADAAEEQGSFAPKLGFMTGGNRDDWAEARQELVRLGMEEALEKLESGAIVLNLDDEAPVSRKECGELFWTGGMTSGHNRWFDKSIQVMVTNNGKAGLIAEHSMMDGMPVVKYADYITNTKYADAKKRSSQAVDGTFSAIGKVENIFEDSLGQLKDPSVVVGLETKALKAFQDLMDSQENHAQSFQGYGSEWIKIAGFSPDAYVQMAMQLASYRLFGEQVGTYEATQVRPFLHGRTETTRTVSPASNAFVQKMGLRPQMDDYSDSDPTTRLEKLELLRQATTAHSQYLRDAASGQGVDRHFFGLSMLVQDGETAPTLFSDPVFIRSKTWRVSTSNLTHPNFALWGYGEVVPDGVGLSYAILPGSCVFHVTALHQTGWTDKLSELLEEALLEMKVLIDTPNN